MDPICHSLFGIALGEAGLKERSRLAGPTLLVGANLPDIDVAAYFWGPVDALAFRRGWTHGPVALLVLPLLLAGVMVLVDALASRRSPARPRTPPGVLWALATIGVLSHPVLDFLNTYGVRWLMPLSPEWFYGDTLFIVDPWVWLTLATGVLLSRKSTAGRSARVALTAVVVYVTLMGAAGLVTRQLLGRRLAADGISWRTVMVAPVPVNPFQREVVVDVGDGYRTGALRLLPYGFVPSPRSLDKNDRHPAAQVAAGTPEGRQFLRWSRFPYYTVDSIGVGGGYLVHIMDARYNREWASVTVAVPDGVEQKTDGDRHEPRPS
jgi:inner membrane protein